jgi:hypothetical protein
MVRRRDRFGWLGLCVCALAIGRAAGEERPMPPPAFGPLRVPLEKIVPEMRERVRAVAERPTLVARGPVETFLCNPATYRWLLDHPDHACRLWRQLGAKVADIHDQGNGRFGYDDGQGNSVHWHSVLDTPGQRVWYAEGRCKPGLLLPTSTVKAVLLLNLSEGQDSLGRPSLRHQMQLQLRADSAVVAMAARLFGASAPHLAEQYVGQIETFFGALAWYLNENPKQAEAMLEKLPK